MTLGTQRMLVGGLAMVLAAAGSQSRGTEPDAGAAECSKCAGAADVADVEFDYAGGAGAADRAIPGRGELVDARGSRRSR